MKPKFDLLFVIVDENLSDYYIVVENANNS